MSGDSTQRNRRLIDLLAELGRLGVSVCLQDDTVSFRVPAGVIDCSEALAETRERLEAMSGSPCLPRMHNECLIPLTARSGSRNLVCVHPGHGTAYDYRFLAAAMPTDYAVHALQAHRFLLGGRAPASVEEMAERYVNELEQNRLCVEPYVVYGASSGGFLAFEMARRLAARGHAPTLLVSADAWDGATMSRRNAQFVQLRLLWLGFMQAYMPAELMMELASTPLFWSTSDAERIRLVIEEARALHGARYPFEMREDVLARHFEVYRAYIDSYRRWSPGIYTGRTLLLRASRTHEDTASGIQRFLKGTVRMRVIEGNHTSLLRPTGAAAIAAAIDAEMRAALECPA